MRLLSIRVLCCLALIAMTLLPAAAEKTPAMPTTPIMPDRWGMVVRDPGYEWGTHPAYPNTVNQPFIDRMLDNLKGIGVEWVRFEVHGEWGAEYGGFNYEQADYFIDAAHARGMKVLMLLGTDILRGPAAPVSAFNAPANQCAPTPDTYGIGCAVNSYMSTWLNRAIAIADRYAGRVDAFEIFNEPNYYWALWDETGTQDEMNPVLVARTITKFFRIIRQRGNQALVIVGGIHPMTSRQTGRTDRAYIAALYAAESFANYHAANGRWPIDGIGYHPYPVEIRDLWNDNQFLYRVGPRLDAVMGVIRTYDATASLWVTEVGTRGVHTNPADMERQAAFLRDLALILDTRRADLGPWFWFKYEDFPGNEQWGVVHVPFDSAGRYDSEGRVAVFKPAYAQYGRMALHLTPRAWVPLLVR